MKFFSQDKSNNMNNKIKAGKDSALKIGRKAKEMTISTVKKVNELKSKRKMKRYIKYK